MVGRRVGGLCGVLTRGLVHGLRELLLKVLEVLVLLLELLQLVDLLLQLRDLLQMWLRRPRWWALRQLARDGRRGEGAGVRGSLAAVKVELRAGPPPRGAGRREGGTE